MKNNNLLIYNVMLLQASFDLFSRGEASKVFSSAIECTEDGCGHHQKGRNFQKILKKKVTSFPFPQVLALSLISIWEVIRYGRQHLVAC